MKSVESADWGLKSFMFANRSNAIIYEIMSSWMYLPLKVKVRWL